MATIANVKTAKYAAGSRQALIVGGSTKSGGGKIGGAFLYSYQDTARTSRLLAT
jgi:hypothetical protein